MTDLNSHFIQLENWIFEIKSIRAIRVESYGQPYDAIANIHLNGENAYIDGLMTRANEEFSREDYQVFHRMCQKLGLKQVQFDRFKNSQASLNTVKVQPIENTAPQLKLVR